MDRADKTVNTNKSKSIAFCIRQVMLLTFKHYVRHTSNLLNHTCLIAKKYGEIRIHLYKENCLKALRIIYKLNSMVIYLYFSTAHTFLNFKI